MQRDLDANVLEAPGSRDQPRPTQCGLSDLKLQSSFLRPRPIRELETSRGRQVQVCFWRK